MALDAFGNCGEEPLPFNQQNVSRTSTTLGFDQPSAPTGLELKNKKEREKTQTHWALNTFYEKDKQSF